MHVLLVVSFNPGHVELLTASKDSTLCSRRARFCCCSMRSDADAGGEAALMLRMTRMLSSGRGGSPSSSRLRTFMLWSCSKPPRVNWDRRQDFSLQRFTYFLRYLQNCKGQVQSVSPECSSTTAVTPSSLGNEGRVRCRTW